MNKHKNGYSSYKQTCSNCGQPTNKTSRKEFCLCKECKDRKDLEKSIDVDIRAKWKTKTICQCCGRRIYGDISKEHLCEFCCTEYTAIKREYGWNKKPKELLFEEIRRIKRQLDDMDCVGTNLQGVRV